MIEIKNLTKLYGKQTVLRNMNWSFPDHGLVCLLGASGCGKSTLLNMLAGFDSEYSGEITVCGTPIHKMSADQLCVYRRDNIGFIFQNYNLLTGYTVLDNILLACELSDNDTVKSCETANALLSRLGMRDKANEKVENLSGGQKQRVAIARALMGNPSIILADEPTGALDRKNATEIMTLLKEISKDRLVLVITHDQKICGFADSILSIQDGQMIGDDKECQACSALTLKKNATVSVSAFHRGLKNFKVHFTRYIAVSLAISIGVLAFMLSLSSGNIMEKSISDFKEKNTAFSNGYVKAEEKTDELLALLKDDARVENIYEQYVINNVTLTLGEKTQTMAEKYPMPKATENMSYGNMPKSGKNQIALSPSFAKKFDHDINKLIDKEVTLTYGEKEYRLTISGIFNAGYDDFFVSSDIEKEFYTTVTEEKPYSISYDVKRFEDIVAVNQMLADKGIKAQTAANEVGALQNTFENLSRLFLVVSLLILGIGLFISVILLVKLQNSRYREIGLLSALGYRKKQIKAIILAEAMLLSALSAILNGLLITIAHLISSILKFDFMITIPQIILSVLGTGIVVMLIDMLASRRLIEAEPATALRK